MSGKINTEEFLKELVEVLDERLARLESRLKRLEKRAGPDRSVKKVLGAE